MPGKHPDCLAQGVAMLARLCFRTQSYLATFRDPDNPLRKKITPLRLFRLGLQVPTCPAET